MSKGSIVTNVMAAFWVGLVFWSSSTAVADTGGSGEPASPQDWAYYGQATFVEQYHPAFRSPYRGLNSLDPGSRGDETFDFTVYAGVKLWDGAEAWINGEVDQGFGLSNSLGVAGFPNGEAYKVGSSTPYPKLPRLFLRQTIDIGGDVKGVDPDINQLGGTQTDDRIVFTLGKMSVADVFDHNQYSDDSRHDFLNWALIDLGTFDYASNAWGYTYGAVTEWYQDWWVIRAGLFDLSEVPNSTKLETTFGRQFQLVTEFEEDHTLWDEPGKLRLLTFLSHGRMGLFSDAISLSEAIGNPADTTLVRHMHERPGIGLNLEQHIGDDLGFFLRTGYDDPSREPFDFIDADETVSAGLSMAGNRWDRPDDTIGLAFLVNGISREHATYFNDGGVGILVGDGKLPRPGSEKIIEALYTVATIQSLKVTADYQFVDNPAYNTQRGPVSAFGVRLHTEF
jgi:high affinity Mn2+ porin